MGVFNNQKTIASTIKYIEMNYDYSYMSHLECYDFETAQNLMGESVVCDILLKFAMKDLDVDYNFHMIQNMYDLICINKSKNQELLLFDKLVSLYVKLPSLFNNQKFNTLFIAFDDKQLVFEFYDYLIAGIGVNNSEYINEDNLKAMMNYIIRARQYYVDDRALLTSAIALIERNNLFDYMHGMIDIYSLVEDKLAEDRKACGIYDIDEEKIAVLEEKLAQIERCQASLLAIIDKGNRTIDSLEKSIALFSSRTSKIADDEIKRLSNKTLDIIREFNAEYEQLLDEKRRSVNDYVAVLTAEIEKAVVEEKGDLIVAGRSVVASVNDEIKRINRIADLSIKQVQKQAQNMTNLGNSGATGGTVSLTENGGNSAAVLAEAPIFMPNIILSEEEQMQDENFLLNGDFPFSMRYEKIKYAMEEDMRENGTIYHKKFDDVIKIIMEGRTPYLYGPSGCGKSYMIQSQLAKLLGVNVLTNGYVMYEQDILGYNSAGNGSYVPSNFYRCFKYGNIIFLDELDNGIANATVVLNRFLEPDVGSYTFPNGVETKRHPNFRIITAGNTNGNGRTYAHNTRQKMDESVIQRLTPIKIDYDNRIERAILGLHLDWYDFVVNFREAIEEGRSVVGNSVMGTITTRDAETIRKYLDDGVFSDEKILEYVFIGNKNRDELSRIIQYMDRLYFDEKSKEIYKTFKKVVKNA